MAWPFPFGISGGSGTRLVYFLNAVEPLADLFQGSGRVFEGHGVGVWG